jgi:sugar lactone lactonase YvrE
VYVVDHGNDRIQKFSSTGAFLGGWGSAGTGDGQFLEAGTIAIDPGGNVYVGDSAGDRLQRVQKFSSDGAFITKWGSYGSGDGHFSNIAALATDSESNVYVGDNVRVKKYNSTGSFVTAWGQGTPGPDQLVYADNIATDSSGYVYVAEALYGELDKFTSTGGYVANWPLVEPGEGYLSGLATDSAGDLYVVTCCDNTTQIRKLSPNGNAITSFGSYGNGDGQFQYSNAIAVDSLGNVYISDPSNSQIQKFKPVQ